MGGKLIIANWKMNGNLEKIKADLSFYVSNDVTNQPNVVLALPDLYLVNARTEFLAKSKIKISAQNVSHYENNGAYTGEISTKMLKDATVDYVIIGHSERRHLMGETGEVLKQKVKNSFTDAVIPVFCVGELLETREAGNYLQFIESQLRELDDIPNFGDIVIAYEPCWSIGTGKIPTLAEIEEVVGYIHQYMQKHFGYVKITVLYGGSVTGTNARDILSVNGVDGVLVGGASLKPDDFVKICANS